MAATPSSPDKRPPAHVWGYTRQCGFASSSSKDGGSPSKTARRPGPLELDATPGAADSLAFPPKKLPEAHPGRSGARRIKRSPVYRIDQHAAFDGSAGTAIACQTREDVARPFAGDGEVAKRDGDFRSVVDQCEKSRIVSPRCAVHAPRRGRGSKVGSRHTATRFSVWRSRASRSSATTKIPPTSSSTLTQFRRRGTMLKAMHESAFGEWGGGFRVKASQGAALVRGLGRCRVIGQTKEKRL